MWKKIQPNLFPLLIAFSALSVSASAAFYSVSGLSKLFAGAAFAVIIMAGSLEVAKLVIASLLYQYRKTLPKFLKIYLTIACVILIGITSMGIYGFLAGAYQTTANKEGITSQQIAALEAKKSLYEDTRNNIIAEKQSNNEFRGTLSKGSTTQHTDKNGNLVVRTNNSAIRNIESTSKANEKLSSKLDVINDSIFSLETQILEAKVNSEATSELGPLKYLSTLTGVSMDKIINWLILIIIFVFDPLAIALVVATNFAFEQIRPKKEISLEENVEGMRKVVDSFDSLQDEIEDHKGAPVMVDPETGKLFYVEDTPELQPPTDIRDLDGDGVVEEAEVNEILDQIHNVGNSFTSAEQFKKDSLNQELDKLRNLFTKSKDTIKRYF